MKKIKGARNGDLEDGDREICVEGSDSGATEMQLDPFGKVSSLHPIASLCTLTCVLITWLTKAGGASWREDPVGGASPFLPKK